MLMKNNKIGILLVLMLIVGICGLLYPAVSQYWNSKTQSRAVSNYQDILASINTDDYTEYFDAAHLSAFIDVPVTIPRVGLGDKTCSPNGILSMFNNIPSGVHKEINFLQGSDHGYLPEPDFQKWYKYTFD